MFSLILICDYIQNKDYINKKNTDFEKLKNELL